MCGLYAVPASQGSTFAKNGLISAGDTTPNMAQIFDAYYKLIESEGFRNASRPAGDLSYADQYM